MILEFFYNNDSAQTTRLRQYDLLDARVGDPDDVVEQVEALFCLPSATLSFKDGLIETFGWPRIIPVEALPPDLELAAQHRVRAPLELLILQNALELQKKGIVAIADLVEFEATPQSLTVYERSLPLYRLPGTILGISLADASRLRTVMRRSQRTVIDPQDRVRLERFYFGERRDSLERDLLHLSKHSFESKWQVSAESLLEQMDIPRIDIKASGALVVLTDNLDGSKVTTELDSITGALFMVSGELNPSLAEALLQQARGTGVTTIYAPERATNVLFGTGQVDVGIETYGTWPAFKRLGFSAPVHYARLKAAAAHLSQGG